MTRLLDPRLNLTDEEYLAELQQEIEDSAHGVTCVGAVTWADLTASQRKRLAKDRVVWTPKGTVFALSWFKR